LPPVGYVISLTQTDRHFAELVKILAPQGKLARIDDRRRLMSGCSSARA